MTVFIFAHTLYFLFLYFLILISSTRSQYSLLICCHRARPQTVCSLKITDRSFRYASSRLWNQLLHVDSFRQPSQSCLGFISFTSQPISVIITTLIIHHSFIFFTPGSKPTFSTNPFHLNFSSLLIDFGTVFMILGLDRTCHAHKFIYFIFYIFFFVPCGRLSWLSVSFLLHCYESYTCNRFLNVCQKLYKKLVDVC